MALRVTEQLGRVPQRRSQVIVSTGDDTSTQTQELTRSEQRLLARRKRTHVSMNGLGDLVVVIEGMD